MNNRREKLVLSTFLLVIASSFCHAQTGSSTCQIPVIVGKVNFCLPTISGMIECINESQVMAYVNSRTIEENQNIALYLDENNKSAIDHLDEEVLENYLLVFTTKNLEYELIDEEFIMLMDSMYMADNQVYLQEIWPTAVERITSKIDGLKMDQPVLIDHYYIAKSAPCLITLVRSIENGFERIYLTATAFFSMHGKFISLAWYLRYDGADSIQQLRSKIDYYYFLLEQMNSNSSGDAKVADFKGVNRDLASAVGYYNSAIDSSNEGKYQQAIDLYSKAIEFYPNAEKTKLSEAYFNRAMNKRQIGDNIGAIKDYSTAIEIRPDYFKAYHNRGFAKMIIKEYQEAISDFSHVINSNGIDKELLKSAYGNRGLSKYELHQNYCDDIKTAVNLGNERLRIYLIDCK
jgi:tetratricopeptide (TPR) repeat protein